MKPALRLFEYHCLESPKSADAQLWYRSHQQVRVLGISERGVGLTFTERCENACPRMYRIRFADGFERDAFEDELVRDAKHFCSPAPPQAALSEKEVQ